MRKVGGKGIRSEKTENGERSDARDVIQKMSKRIDDLQKRYTSRNEEAKKGDRLDRNK